MPRRSGKVIGSDNNSNDAVPWQLSKAQSANQKSTDAIKADNRWFRMHRLGSERSDEWDRGNWQINIHLFIRQINDTFIELCFVYNFFFSERPQYTQYGIIGCNELATIAIVQRSMQFHWTIGHSGTIRFWVELWPQVHCGAYVRNGAPLANVPRPGRLIGWNVRNW